MQINCRTLFTMLALQLYFFSCYFRKYEDIRNYSQTLQGNITSLLKVQQVGIFAVYH